MPFLNHTTGNGFRNVTNRTHRLVYELLFRSRWYALAWALFMAASAVMFTTTGAGAWLVSSKPDARTSEELRENAYRSWAEDDKRRSGDENGFDPSSPEQVRDGVSQRDEAAGAERRTVPFNADETEDEEANAPVSQ